MIKRFSLIMICVLIETPVAFAELEWKATSQNITVHPLQASTVVPFAFTNAGTEPVTISDLKPSCGCIAGKIAKKTFAPGESGTVMVTFNLQGRLGAQLKGLEVVTQDGRRTSLYINTTIPETYSPSVARTVWGPREEHAPKTVRLTNASPTPFTLEKAVPVREGLTVELKPVREGFEYDLVITPSEDLNRMLIPIIIHPEKPGGLAAVRTYTVYALVK